MDHKQFDGMTRALAGGMTRRGGLAAVIAGVLGAAGISVAAANPGRRHEKLACRNANSECTSDDQCCSGSCVPKPEGGTGFRCAKRHKRKKGNGGGKGGGGSLPLIPLGEPCQPGASECIEGTCQEYLELAQSNLGRFGFYCTNDSGAECPANPTNPPESWMAPTCVGGYCAYTNGDNTQPGVCGDMLLVNSCTVANSICTTENLSDCRDTQSPGLCGSKGNYPFMVVDWDAGAACTEDIQCLPTQLCISASDVDTNPCGSAFNSGYCAAEARYVCATAQDCPPRNGYGVSCTTWYLSTGTYCYYQAT